MSGFQLHGHKRREPDDELQELQNLSLSPPKKLRILDSTVSPSFGQGSNYASRSVPETRWGDFPRTASPPIPIPLVANSPSQPVVEEERAIVLYRPVAPPTFQGSLPVRSVDFPYSARSSMLPIQALDLSNGLVAYIGRRQLSRVSSCSSLPCLAVHNEDQVMVQEIDKSTDLAVIPWVPMTPIVAPQVRPIIEEADDKGTIDDDDAPMADEDTMEVVNDNQVIVTEDSMTPMAGQFGSPMPSLSAAPWQTEVLQPPFTTPMWSH